MNPHSSLPHSDLDPAASNLENPEASKVYSEQQLELKQDVEQLARDLDRVRGVLQTLVSGLVISVLITLSITAWFAYRLMVQERRSQLEMSELEEAETERLAQIEELQAQVQSQQQQLQGLQQQIPGELTTLTDTILSNQRQLQLLRDRVLQVETEIQPPTPPTPLSPLPSPDPAFSDPSTQPQGQPQESPPPPQVQPSGQPQAAPSSPQPTPAAPVPSASVAPIAPAPTQDGSSEFAGQN